MPEEKYTEEEINFIKEQCRILSSRLDKAYDDIFKIIAELDTEDMIKIMKNLSEHDKK